MNEIEVRVIQLCIEKKRKNENAFYGSIADVVREEFGVELSTERIRTISRKYRKDNHLDENFFKVDSESEEKPVTVSLLSDGSTVSEKSFSVAHNTELTPELLLEKHGFDKDYFELVSAKNSRWNVQKKGSGIVDMYSSKITVRPAKEFIWSQSNIDRAFSNIKIKPAPSRKLVHVTHNGRCLVVPISDLHLGLLSEKKVSGNDYNLEIAESLYYYVLNDVVNEVNGQSFEKVMFIIGNDFINADNITNTTTKGTPQDCSNQWHTIIDKAIELCINGINMLTAIAPVDVIYAVSNHDYHSMYGIMNTLQAYYRNDELVKVYGDPSERKYFKFGSVIVGVAHDIKPDKALEIMSVEAHDMWSECKSMIWFLGHLHTQMAYSKKGYVEVLRLPTVSGWSRWSNQQGYVQTERKNQAFIIDENTGIKTTINTVIKL
jgi:hypothetical protein|nr:MAG TPA: DNA polymerase II small subunit [Caudoviricetes sp.]